MNTSRKIMMLLAIVATAFVMGCTKDNPNNGGNGGGNGNGGGGNGNGGGGYYEEHEYVDLGLPSGTLWATCNVGANDPKEYGKSFRWGETKQMGGPYKHCHEGDINQLTKYCQLPDFGYNGYTDKFLNLQPEDDAATVNWGSDWRTPTMEDWMELYSADWEWVEYYDHETHVLVAYGYNITGPNGNTIFLPDRGASYYPDRYLSSTLCPNDPTLYYCQTGGRSYGEHGRGLVQRNSGWYVRPVRASEGGNNGNEVGEGGIGTIQNHEYVDLGLPSGKLWATCNIGASNPSENGSYFAWAETEPKESYEASSYKYGQVVFDELEYTKYCTESDCGYNGFVDNLTTLLPEDDAATVNWGGRWHTPTKEDWEELINNCFHGVSKYNGVDGFMFVSRNGHFLFLPIAGCYFSYYIDDYIGYTMQYPWLEQDRWFSCYWSSSLYEEWYDVGAYELCNKHKDDILDLGWPPQRFEVGVANRYNGLPVRPIYTPD